MTFYIRGHLWRFPVTEMGIITEQPLSSTSAKRPAECYRDTGRHSDVTVPPLAERNCMCIWREYKESLSMFARTDARIHRTQKVGGNTGRKRLAMLAVTLVRIWRNAGMTLADHWDCGVASEASIERAQRERCLMVRHSGADAEDHCHQNPEAKRA